MTNGDKNKMRLCTLPNAQCIKYKWTWTQLILCAFINSVRPIETC